METGARIRFFAEMDANRKDGFDGRYALILRPVEPMEMGHRMAVVIRDDLKKADGGDIAPTPVLKALRDATITTNDVIEKIRPAYEEIFGFLDTHGYKREHVVLAWDFHIASEDYLLGSVLSMRETALPLIGDKGLGYTITNVIDCAERRHARIVEGDFEVPTFLRDDDPSTTTARITRRSKPRRASYPFNDGDPQQGRRLAAPARRHRSRHLRQRPRLPHRTQATGRRFQALCQQSGAVAIATD